MEFKATAGFVLNRGGERLVADENGIISTGNKEAIEVLSALFPNKEEWKSKAKK